MNISVAITGGHSEHPVTRSRSENKATYDPHPAVAPSRLERLIAEPAGEGVQRDQRPGPADSDAASHLASCTLEARFNRLGPGYYHAYLITTDAQGSDYFRGGPGRRPAERPDIGASGSLISAAGGALSQRAGSDRFHSSNSGNSVSAGSGPGGGGSRRGVFGAIEIDSGVYDQHSVDWQSATVPSVTVAVEAGDCKALETRLAQAAARIVAREIPYNPLSTNSNAVARELLEHAGFADIDSPVWAPGWRSEL